MTNYISISNSDYVIEAETLQGLARANASHYGDEITLQDDGQSIRWYRNGKQQPQSWHSQQDDPENGYSLKEAEIEAYRLLLRHYQQALGVAVYRVKPIFVNV
jgi:hypothetical protein